MLGSESLSCDDVLQLHKPAHTGRRTDIATLSVHETHNRQKPAEQVRYYSEATLLMKNDHKDTEPLYIIPPSS